MAYICRLCGSEATLLPKHSDTTQYECPKCDTVHLTRSAEAVLDANPDKATEYRARIVREQKRGIKVHRIKA